MPRLFLSPSTQEWNPYNGGGNEEQYMNLLADRMEPYLRSCGISFVRNDPDRNVGGAIADSNAQDFEVHLALHSNAAPESRPGSVRGVEVYYSPYSVWSEKLAVIIANNIRNVYRLPSLTKAIATTTLGEVTRTRAVAVLAELGYHDNDEDAEWLRTKHHIDLGNITDLIPLERGKSGRIWKLEIVGTKGSFTIGKELEIRRTLSDTHLKSSWFEVEKIENHHPSPNTHHLTPNTQFILKGKGWGHGVGLCQIGAAVMGENGKKYDEILKHYYNYAKLTTIY